MKLSEEEFQGAVQNAHIEMREEALLACRQEMEFVATWAEALDTLPLEGVKPTAGVGLFDNCPTRPDVATESMGSNQALAQAPAKLGSCFLVPKVMD